jgi:hypothetical protein
MQIKGPNSRTVDLVGTLRIRKEGPSSATMIYAGQSDNDVATRGVDAAHSGYKPSLRHPDRKPSIWTLGRDENPAWTERGTVRAQSRARLFYNKQEPGVQYNSSPKKSDR